MTSIHASHEDLTGQQFGEWVVIGLHSRGPRGRRWLCKCSCPQGTLSVKITTNVVKGGGCVKCRASRVRTRVQCSTVGCGAEIELPRSVARSHQARAGIRCKECHRVAADWASRVSPGEVRGRVCYWCLRKDADTCFHNNVECQACARRGSRNGRCRDCLAPLTKTFVHVCGVPTPVPPRPPTPSTETGPAVDPSRSGKIDLSARGRGRCPVCDAVISSGRAVCSIPCRVVASQAGITPADVWEALAHPSPAAPTPSVAGLNPSDRADAAHAGGAGSASLSS